METLKYYCDICHKPTDTFVASKIYQIVRGSTDLQIEADARFCKLCKNPIYDLELDQSASEKLILSYNQRYGVTGQAIIDFRNKFNLSQSTFSKIIGIAKKTLISYETEQVIPSEHYLQILKVVMENPTILGSFAKNSTQTFTFKELDKLAVPGLNETFMTVQESNLEYHGYQPYQPDKIAELLLFFCQSPSSITMLNKSLFYADFSYYHEEAVSITGAVYQKAPYGPIINELKKILEMLVSEGLLIKNKIQTNEYDYYLYKTNDFKGFKLLSESEQTIAKSVKLRIEKCTASNMSEDSHEEEAWQNTEVWDDISYHHATNLKKVYK